VGELLEEDFDSVFNNNPIDDFFKAYYVAQLKARQIPQPD
jgi:hypothetical protein